MKRLVLVPVFLLLVAACSSDTSDADVAGTTTQPTTTTTVTTTTTTQSTTTTAAAPSTTSTLPGDEPIDPTLLTVEERAALEAEIEAAYLQSWEEAYEAVETWDTEGLEDYFHGGSLETRLDQVERHKNNNVVLLGRMEHNFQVILQPDGSALVIDVVLNHLVETDATTREPLEDDPNEIISYGSEMERIGGKWKVVLLIKYVD